MLKVKKQISPYSELINDVNKIFNKGKAYLETAEYEKAIECFNKALSKNPKFNRALKNRKILFNLFFAYMRNNDLSNSTQTLLQMIRINPNKAFNHFEQGLVCLNKSLKNRENAFPDALKHFSMALSTEPKDPDVWYYRGYTKLLMGNENEAEKDFKMVLLLDRNYKYIHCIQAFERIRYMYS